MAKRIILPDGFSDLGPITLPEFAPDQTTMDRFDHEPLTLWRACSEWWKILRRHPHIADPEYQIECGFNDLTAALMLWASTHGLGDGMELADAVAGGDIWRAQSFLDAMRNRAQLGTPSPTDQSTAQAPTPPPANGTFTVRQLARHLQVGPDKIRGWINSGELKATNTSKDPRRKRWIISLEALAEFQARRQPETPPKPAPRRRRPTQMVDYFP
jgi:hypothetical protein